MAGRRAAPKVEADELEQPNELAMSYLNEFGGGEDSLTDGFLRAYHHAHVLRKNDEKASILFAMNHGMDDEFNPED